MVNQIWSNFKYGLNSNKPEKNHLKNADQYENMEFRLLNYQLFKPILIYSKNRIGGLLMVKFLSCFLYTKYIKGGSFFPTLTVEEV